MSIHPQIIEKAGRKEFVVPPYEEFPQMQSEIEDYEDFRTLLEEKATARVEPTRSLDDVPGKIENLAHCPVPGFFFPAFSANHQSTMSVFTDLEANEFNGSAKACYPGKAPKH